MRALQFRAILKPIKKTTIKKISKQSVAINSNFHIKKPSCDDYLNVLKIKYTRYTNV